MRVLVAIAALCISFLGCRSNTPTPPLILPPGAAPGVYILNEGGFSGGGGASFYDLDADTVYHNAIEGSGSWVFPNDMKVVGSKGYVAVNGSDRIDVIDIPAQTVLGSIAFPQYTGPGFLAVSGETLWVANYDGSVSIVDLRADTLVAKIPGVVGFPGGIAVAGGRVFVSDIGLFPAAGTWVHALRPGSPIERDSVHVENAPGPLVEMGGKIIVVCTGTSMVYRIDPATLGLVDSVQLDSYVSDCASDGEFLYVLSADSIAKLDDNPLTILYSSLVGRSGGSYFYALAVQRPQGILFVSNVVSGGGSGRVESYYADGTVYRPPFPVGIFPGAFAFRP